MSFLYASKIQAFGKLMEKQLRQNDHKGGWTDEADGYLLRRLQQEVNELVEAVKDRRTTIGAEAADVANFCMMIADNWGYLREPERIG